MTQYLGVFRNEGDMLKMGRSSTSCRSDTGR